MRRVLCAGAAACALLAAPAAEATPANGFPVVTGVVGDFVCGYAAASPFGIQCYTIANVAAKAASTPPGGSTTQVQYNNGGAFSGIAGFTWNGSTLTLPSTTLPDGGTLTSSLNTFNKVSFYAGADNTPADTIDSSGSHFGSIFATGSDAWALGISTSSTSVGAGIINWSQVAGSNNIDLTATGHIDLNGLVQFRDSANTTTWATANGASGKLNIPFGSVLQMSGAGFSADAAATTVIDLGNGAAGDASGTLNLATLVPSIKLGFPINSNVTSSAQGVTTSGMGIAGPITLYSGAGNSQAAVTNGQSIIGRDTVNAGYGYFLRGTGSLIGNGPMSNLSMYPTSFQLSLVANTHGTNVAGLESGPNDNILEIGTNADAGTNKDITGIVFLDTMVPAGSIQHITVTAGGAGYTSGTVSASLSGGACTTYPTLIVTVSSGAVKAIGSASGNVGAGCTSAPTVTISDSGAGTGATATSTIVTGTTDATTGPSLYWRGRTTATGGGVTYVGLGQASLLKSDMRFGPSFGGGGWGNPWTPTDPAYLRFSNGITFDVPALAGGYNEGPSLQDCNNPTVGAASGILCITASESGSGAPAAISASFARLAAVTLAALNTADPSPAVGDRGTVTDANACTFNTTVTGGGSTPCPVVYLAGAWKAG